MQKKPRLFIGSSNENLPIAHAIHAVLQQFAEVTVWDQDVFELSGTALTSLLNKFDSFDCAIFIFAPDADSTIRDNVIFELGLFVGKFGLKRSFIFIPSDYDEKKLPSDLLGITVAKYEANRHDRELRSAVRPACDQVKDQISSFPRHENVELESSIKFIKPDDFTHILLQKLRDKATTEIQLVLYTGEVDQGNLSRYHVKGKKKIEIYKRSALADLSDSQDYNLYLLQKGNLITGWQKFDNNVRASQLYNNQDLNKDCNIYQYLYLSSPFRRVYLFNKSEALVSFYNISNSIEDIEKEGSIFIGMSNTHALHVTNNSQIGEYFLNEIQSYILRLKKTSHSWDEEYSAITGKNKPRWLAKRPCLNPKKVLIDVDGVLLNSLSFWEDTWKKSFDILNLDYPEFFAFEHEGRSIEETIRERLKIEKFDGIVLENHIKKSLKKIEDFIEQEIKLRPKSPILDGSKELINSIHQSGMEIWVVTGSTDPTLPQRLIEEFGSAIHQKRIITGKDYFLGKPSPEPYIIACAKAKCEPHDTLCIENSPLGVQSATEAGVFCIAVNTGPIDENILVQKGARAVFKSCNDLASKWHEMQSLFQIKNDYTLN